MAKPRVHEIAKELGVTSKEVIAKLAEQGEFVKGASSTLNPLVVKKLREAFPTPAQAPEKLKSQLKRQGSLQLPQLKLLVLSPPLQRSRRTRNLPLNLRHRNLPLNRVQNLQLNLRLPSPVPKGAAKIFFGSSPGQQPLLPTAGNGSSRGSEACCSKARTETWCIGSKTGPEAWSSSG